MNIQLQIAEINKIEKNGVSIFEFDGVNWWPLIRVYLFQNHKIDNQSNSEQAKPSTLNYFRRVLLHLSSWKHTYHQFQKIYNKDAYRNLKRVGTCFITYEANYVLNAEGKLINRYLDPLFFETTGTKVIFVRSNKKQTSYVTPHLLATNYFELKWLLKKQFISLLHIVFFLKEKLPYSKQHEQKIVEIIEHIKSFSFFENFNFSHLTKWIDKTKKSADIAHTVFNKIQPKQLIQYCYYFSNQFGYTLAANKLGIKTIDYQHGIQNAFHYAYGSWNNVPKQGFNLLPNEFWVYSKREEQNLLKSFYGLPHTISVVGNTWLNYWQQHKATNENLSWLHTLILKGHKIILFTVSACLLEDGHFFWEYLKNFKTNDLYILFRLHPGYLQVKDTLVNKLEYINFQNYNIDDTTKTELYDLLGLVHLHLTQHSTVAEEALNFGLSTIILDEQSKVYFKEYIDKEEMFLPLNIQDFITLVNRMAIAKINRRQN